MRWKKGSWRCRSKLLVVMKLSSGGRAPSPAAPPEGRKRATDDRRQRQALDGEGRGGHDGRHIDDSGGGRRTQGRGRHPSYRVSVGPGGRGHRDAKLEGKRSARGSREGSVPG